MNIELSLWDSNFSQLQTRQFDVDPVVDTEIIYVFISMRYNI